MKYKLLSVLISGIALSMVAIGANQQNFVETKATDPTYVSVYTNPCANVGKGSGYDANANTGEINGINWRLMGYASYDGGWRIGGRSISSAERPLFTLTATSDTIDKVVLTTGAQSGSDITVDSLSLNVYSTLSTYALSGLVETVNATYAASSEITFLNSNGNDWSGKYLEFVFTMTNATANNQYIRLTGIDFYKITTDDSVILDKSAISMNTGGNATLTATASGAVTWTSDPTGIVSITPSGTLNETATITASAAGSTTITATVGTASATCTVTVSTFVSKFEEITDWSDINYGDVIAFGFKDPGVAITGFSGNQLISESNLVNDSIDEYMPFQVVRGYTSDTYSFVTSEGKYLRNNDALLYLNNNIDALSSWSITFTDGVINITNASTGRKLAWRVANNYARVYTAYNDSWTAPTVYRYSVSTEAEINEAESFALLFLNALRADGVCDVTGVNSDLDQVASIWTTYADQYKALSDGAKAYIAKTAGNASGTDLQVLINVYAHILEKYSASNDLADFMYRNVVSSARHITMNVNDNMALFVIIPILTIILLTTFFVFRKIKHN